MATCARVALALVAITACRERTTQEQAAAPPPQIAADAALPDATPPTWDESLAALRAALGAQSIEVVVASPERSEYVTSGCSKKPKSLRVVNPDGFIAIIEDMCTRCPLATSDSAAGILAVYRRELARIPTSFLASTKLETIVLCRSLTLQTRPLDTIGGTLSPVERTIFLSLGPFAAAPFDDPRRFLASEALHHELFHLFERATFWKRTDLDPDWREIPADRFRYGRRKSTDPIHPDFVNRHAMSAIAEDKASTYDDMLTRPRTLCRKLQRSKNLRTKTEIIRSRVREAIGADATYLDLDCPRR